MKRKISILLCVCLLFGCLITFAGADTAVERLQQDGILVGDETGALRLNDTITRAEFSRLVWETGLIEEGKTFATFSDVSDTHWAYSFIGKMAGAGLLCGYPDGTFRPEEPIQLIHAERILLRVLFEDPMLEATDFQCGSLAMDLNLLDYVRALQYETITRQDAACMIDGTRTEAIDGDTSVDFIPAVLKNQMTAITSGGGSSVKTEMITDEDGAVSYDVSAPIAAIGGTVSLPFPFEEGSTENYAPVEESGFRKTAVSPLSTFSIDTDTASYSNMRRFVLSGNKPTKGAVRIEELINYFTYENRQPENGEPFSVTTEVSACPWNEKHLLARVSVQGEELQNEERQPQNLVFLVDISGSMYDKNKLPLVKKSIGLLLEQLDERDTVSLVTYANGTEVVLEGVNGTEKEKIQETIDSLYASGGTAGEAGLNLAYKQAEAHLKDGNNRIILCTDGDFNIGPSSDAEMKALVEEKREKGIFISVLGFGMGNYKDNRLEILADNGNGNYFYIDSLKEAKKVLSDEMTKTLYTIAKDVKIQTEFNPDTVEEYRLIGYENRMLNTEDFTNDKKDGGELGAGSTVTVLYEIIPGKGTDAELRYQTAETTGSDELFCVNIRYKEPKGTESKLLQFPTKDISQRASKDFYFAAAVAEFGMLLNQSEFCGSASYDSVLSLAKDARGEDEFGYRSEFISLVDLMRMIE